MIEENKIMKDALIDISILNQIMGGPAVMNRAVEIAVETLHKLGDLAIKRQLGDKNDKSRVFYAKAEEIWEVRLKT